jgi:hypothetical protein
MKAHGGSDCIDPHFLNLGTAGGEWSASRTGRFTPGERASSTHWIGGWVNPRAGLDDMEKWKFLPHLDSNTDPSVVQPVISRYTDCAIPALNWYLLSVLIYQNMFSIITLVFWDYVFWCHTEAWLRKQHSKCMVPAPQEQETRNRDLREWPKFFIYKFINPVVSGNRLQTSQVEVGNARAVWDISTS